MFPLASFERIDDDVADRHLVAWGHWLEGCNRPYARNSFGLYANGQLVSVAVTASTVNGKCGGWDRQSVIELARLCSLPDQRWATRVCLRLWRELAPMQWDHWRADAAVSYQNAVRHSGNIYRFDGWTKVADVKGSTGGGTYSTPKIAEPKAVWVYVYGEMADERRREIALERAA